MITNVKVPLRTNEYRALEECAEEDIRNTADQVRHLVREALKERHLLEAEQTKNEKKVSH
jgi:hypothetical protein